MAKRPDWYGYIYPKNFIVLSKPKLVIPDICEHMQVGIDETGSYIFSGGGAGGNAIVPPDPQDMWYLLGVLNSRTVEAYVRETGTAFRGGYLNCEIRFIRDIPIRTGLSAEERRIAGRIGQYARAIVEKRRVVRVQRISEGQKERFAREIDALEAQVEGAVGRLYGIDESDASR
jgi:hypothetical protein